MVNLAEWLLDLENIRLGRDVPLSIKFGVELPAWLLLACALAVLTWIVVVYRREQVSAKGRAALVVLRAAEVALVAAVLCQPSLVLQRERIEPSHVVLLVDTSHSMSATEPYPDASLREAVSEGAGLASAAAIEQHSRLELVQRALTRDGAAPLAALLHQNGLELAGFSGTVERQAVAAAGDGLPALVGRIEQLKAEGTSTDLAGALTGVIQEARGRRLAAIVLASDGQATEPTGLPDALDLARGSRIPIYPIRLGADRRPPDLALGLARAEPRVFLKDMVAIEAPLSAAGVDGPVAATVQLVDDGGGAVLAATEVELDPAGAPTNIELRIQPSRTGRVRYRLVVTALPEERDTANNEADVEVTVVSDKVRVLYVEGYPRFEYRYLKNALLREETIELSVLLLEADSLFVQEGGEPIRRFPDTPEQLGQYDVVLFGDVDPQGGWLTEAQRTMLLDFVGHDGGGFGLIAGPRSAPHRFGGTALERLLPVRLDPEFLGRSDVPAASGFQMQLTPEGRRSRLFRFLNDTRPASATQGDLSSDPVSALPELYWCARTLGPKPGAAILAEHPTLRVLTVAVPLVVLSRYGPGKVFFQATDDTWRWRRVSGEFLHDTYWVQVVRELLGGDRAGTDRRYVLRADRRAYRYGSAVEVKADLLDPQLLALHPKTLTVVVREALAGTEPTTAPVVDRIELQRVGPTGTLYEGTFLPPRAGSYMLQAEDLPAGYAAFADAVGMQSGIELRPATVNVRVDAPDLEARRPEADHRVLQRIADATSGRIVEMNELTEVFGAIRDRSVRIPDDLVEPLWDSKLTLVLFLLLITVDWSIRKAFGLL